MSEYLFEDPSDDDPATWKPLGRPPYIRPEEPDVPPPKEEPNAQRPSGTTRLPEETPDWVNY